MILKKKILKLLAKGNYITDEFSEANDDFYIISGVKGGVVKAISALGYTLSYNLSIPDFIYYIKVNNIKLYHPSTDQLKKLKKYDFKEKIF